MRILLCILTAAACLAQPSPENLVQAKSKMDELTSKLAKAKAPEDLRADVEIYLKAAQWITRHPEEFYKPEYNDQLLAVLDRGLARAAELDSGAPSWPR